MNRSGWLTACILVALAGVGVLCALTVFGLFSWFIVSGPQVGVLDVASVSAEAAEELSLAARPNLVIRSSAGDIEVTGSDRAGIEVELAKKAWGADQEAAERALEALEVAIRESGDTLELSYERPEQISLVGSRSGMDSVSFLVRVPADTRVTLETAFGDVILSDIRDDANLQTGFGRIEATSVAGAVLASTENGEISLREIDAGDGDVAAETGFGDITMVVLQAANIRIDTINGDIEGSALHAESAVGFTTRFGSIQLSDFQAETMDGGTENGNIILQDGVVVEKLEARSGFSAIDVSRVAAGSYVLFTRNGDIILAGAGGLLDLESSFGSIEVAGGEDAALSARTDNGSINYSGSLREDAAHQAKTRFGDIDLSLPADSAFDLLLKTSFGEISSEIPLELAGSINGSPVGSQELEAAINGGGPLLTLETSDGDISIHTLPGE
jgi:DUF4097 and DUF4098 domain-containing protein YvlB